MSVTGRKSIESLIIYQRVQADEKLMMGMWLTYNLLHPNEALQLRQQHEEKLKEQENQIEDQQPPALPAPPAPNDPVPITSTSNQCQALVPVENEIQHTDQNSSAVPDFSLQEILHEFQADNETDDILMTATQIQDNQMQAKSAMIRKTSITKEAKSTVLQLFDRYTEYTHSQELMENRINDDISVCTNFAKVHKIGETVEIFLLQNIILLLQITYIYVI